MAPECSEGRKKNRISKGAKKKLVHSVAAQRIRGHQNHRCSHEVKKNIFKPIPKIGKGKTTESFY